MVLLTTGQEKSMGEQAFLMVGHVKEDKLSGPEIQSFSLQYSVHRPCMIAWGHYSRFYVHCNCSVECQESHVVVVVIVASHYFQSTARCCPALLHTLLHSVLMPGFRKRQRRQRIRLFFQRTID